MHLPGPFILSFSQDLIMSLIPSQIDQNSNRPGRISTLAPEPLWVQSDL